MITIFLIISIILNIFFCWYIVQLISRLVIFQEEIDSFAQRLDEYSNHVDILYNLERFFGDETLANLLRHSKAIVEECKDFQSLIKPEEDLEEDIEEDLEEADYAKETQQH